MRPNHGSLESPYSPAETSRHTTRRRWAAVCSLALLFVNSLAVAPLFAVEYSASVGSNEGSFIAIARVMAEHPGEWLWWPYWAGGMPFEMTYLPLLQWVVAAFSLLTGFSPARSFHIVTATLYVLAPVTAFGMALALSRRLAASFLAALAYSSLPLSAVLVPAIRADAGGAFEPRRLQTLVFYGEAPHLAALALAPVAIVCLAKALTARDMRWKILAGALSAAVALANAFGAVLLAIASLCLLLAYRPKPLWKGARTLAVLGLATYCWISPWLTPRLIAAMRDNSATAGGDYRYTGASWAALALTVGGFVVLSLWLRRAGAPPHLSFFTLFAYFPVALVTGFYAFGVAVIPQPFRYHLELDLALALAVTLWGAWASDRASKSVRIAVTAGIGAVLVFQSAHTVQSGRVRIQSVDPGELADYKIAKWMEQNRPGERAFVAGSRAFLYNVFVDNSQFHGAHEQHIANPFVRVAAFTIYSGMNAGAGDAEYSLFWLKAFGAAAVTVSGPDSTEYFQPFANPNKFDGMLPLLWREDGDSIYEVPRRSSSLAHVMPAAAVPARRPAHGLDIEPVEAYVAALDNPSLPKATFRWIGLSAAEIDATVEPGQVIAVQITYAPGWEARAEGKSQHVRADAIGQTVIEPDRESPCRISLRYTGGLQTAVTRLLSCLVTLLALVLLWRGSSRSIRG